MKHPFSQKKSNGRLIREFSADVPSSELVWHRDRADRQVKVRSGKGWQLQIENSLPKNLIPGEIYFIPKNTYHRVIKGQQSLVVEIEERSVKITRRQLRRIIKEELLSERGTGNPALQSEERAIMDSVVNFVDKYRLTMGFDPNDFGDDKRVRQAVQDIISGVLGEDM